MVFNYGEIKDYELVFGGDYPSLNGAISNIKEKEGSVVYGMLSNLDRVSLLKLEKYYFENFNKPVNFMIIYDTYGNRHKGFSFYLKDDPSNSLSWSVPPSINTMSEIYKKYIKLSKNKLLYIYDNMFNKKGVFNGKSYDKIDDKQTRIGMAQMKQFKLKNPNPFHERILKHDSPLFQENIYNSDGNLIKQKDIQNIAVNVGGMFAGNQLF